MGDDVDISNVEAALRQGISAIEWPAERAEWDQVESQHRRVMELWNAAFAALGMSVRGHSRTEARLRELYARAEDEKERVFVAQFLWHWKSKRGLAVADDWLTGDPSWPVYQQILFRYSLCDRMDAFDRFLQEIEKRQSDPERLTTAIHELSESLMHRERYQRYQEGLAAIAQCIDHPSEDVRWMVVISLGRHRAKQYKDAIAALSNDETRSQCGLVSAMARKAVRFIEGDEDVDFFDASEP